MMFDQNDVIHVTWRRVLRTPVHLLEGVPQVMKNDVLRNDPGGLRWCLGVIRNALE